MNTEAFPHICFHKVDIENVERKWDERIERLRGGGGMRDEIAAAKEMRERSVDAARRHTSIHTLDEKAIELEGEMMGIRKQYEAKGLAGAEKYDKGYIRLRNKWDEVGSTYPYYMVPAGSPHYTTLKTDWEILSDLIGDESLVRGGTDEQHEREIFDPY